MSIGKVGIIFGHKWFSSCKSCYQVDSVKSIREAIDSALNKTEKEVRTDVVQFIKSLKNRVIYGTCSRFSLRVAGKEYNYKKGVKNIARAIYEVSK